LTGTGGTDAQAVRAHTAFGTFLDVQVDDVPGFVRADGHLVQLADRAGPPRLVAVDGDDVTGQAQLLDVVQRRGQRLVAGAVGSVRLAGGDPPRGELPGHRGGLLHAQRVRPTEPLHAVLAADTDAVLVHHEAHSASDAEVSEHIGQVDQGDAGEPAFDDQLLFPADLGVVDDDDDVRLAFGRGRVAAE